LNDNLIHLSTFTSFNIHHPTLNIQLCMKDSLPQHGPSARIDKWLWAARIYKTRSLAVDAIKNSRVTVDGANVKPSHIVKEGQVVSVKKPPITYSFRILACIEQRVGAKLIPQVYENITDPKQYELLEMSRISGFVDRARGTGRPTKKERRALDAFIEPAMFGFDDDDE
jgi:ribosome-associated heat shock protein Hsp15